MMPGWFGRLNGQLSVSAQVTIDVHTRNWCWSLWGLALVNIGDWGTALLAFPWLYLLVSINPKLMLSLKRLLRSQQCSKVPSQVTSGEHGVPHAACASAPADEDRMASSSSSPPRFYTGTLYWQNSVVKGICETWFVGFQHFKGG